MLYACMYRYVVIQLGYTSLINYFPRRFDRFMILFVGYYYLETILQ